MTNRNNIREQQAEAVGVLDELLTTNLPVCYWVVAHATPRKLTGQVPTYARSIEQVLLDLKEWAQYLGVELEYEDWGQDQGEKVTATKMFGEIQVEIWSHVQQAAKATAA